MLFTLSFHTSIHHVKLFESRFILSNSESTGLLLLKLKQSIIINKSLSKSKLQLEQGPLINDETIISEESIAAFKEWMGQ